MSYDQAILNEYRAILQASTEGASPFPFSSFPNCPYCNGTRDPTVKHTSPSTKPATPYDFYTHVLLRKYCSSLGKEKDKEEDSASPPLLAVGPMVDQSEIPFRLLCRSYGSNLTYTPMLHARLFVETFKYRHDMLQLTNLTNELLPFLEEREKRKEDGSGEEEVVVDRPVIVQFCANDGDTLLEAARGAVCGEAYYANKNKSNPNPPTVSSAPQYTEYIEYPTETVDGGAERYYHCDAVDLNLGCPQGIARRGQYGSFLMEDWERIHILIHTLHVELEVPVTAKIRVFDTPQGSSADSTSVQYDEALSIAYAKMVQSAGAQLITIHGRIRSQKGQHSGLADMPLIGKIALALNQPYLTSGDPKDLFPVLSNGNVLHGEDVAKHLAYYQSLVKNCGPPPSSRRPLASVVVGHMCAEPLLWDPKLFRYVKEDEKKEREKQLGVPSGRTGEGATKAMRLTAVQTAMDYVEWCKKCCIPRDRDTPVEVLERIKATHPQDPQGHFFNVDLDTFPVDSLLRWNISFSDIAMMKPHLFKILFHSYDWLTDLRDEMGNFESMAKSAFEEYKERMHLLPSSSDSANEGGMLTPKQMELYYYRFQIQLIEDHLKRVMEEEEGTTTGEAPLPRLGKERKQKEKEALHAVNFFEDDNNENDVGLIFF